MWTYLRKTMVLLISLNVEVRQKYSSLSTQQSLCKHPKSYYHQH